MKFVPAWNLLPPLLNLQLGRREYLKKQTAEKQSFLAVAFPYFYEIIKEVSESSFHYIQFKIPFTY